MRNAILYIILFFAAICIWEFAGSSIPKVRLLVSYPSISLEYFIKNFSRLLNDTMTTLLEAVLGLLIATAVAFTLMVICFASRAFHSFVIPLMVASQVIPLIVLAPFAVIAFGSGLWSKVFLAALISFFPIFVNFSRGYQSIGQNTFELLDILNAKLKFRIFRIYFPLCLPNIFAGLRISSTLSVIGAIVAEFAGAESGLGKNLLFTSIRIEPELMMNSIFLSAFIGGLIYLSVFLIEKRVGRWYLSNELSIP